MSVAWGDDWRDAIFSQNERDRRWAKIRALMARDRVDVIVCLPCSNNHNRGAGSGLYLTQLGENSDEIAAYFPIDGDVTVWASEAGPWPKSNWLDDIRLLARGNGGAMIVGRLQESGFRRGTIGIAGLAGGIFAHCREAEGEANWTSVQMIKEKFPDAKIVSATDLVGEARFQKSEEELHFLQNGAAICDEIHNAVARTARPGVAERRVFAEMMYTNSILGGTFTPMVGWISGRKGKMRHRLELPTLRRLEAEDILLLEIDGRYGGYIAQIDSMFTMGRAHQDTKDAFALALESFNRVAERMKPGVTVGELVDAAQVEGMGGRGVASLTMHGRGTGDDGPPVFGGAKQRGIRDIVMVEGAVMAVKPAVSFAGDRPAGRFGDNVVVTPGGGVRLSKRRPEVVECL